MCKAICILTMYNKIIDKYYPEDNEQKRMLLSHSRDVADKALTIADRHPELNIDRKFLEEAAMLHDIGILHTNAPSIHCHGAEHYIRHGVIGAQMLRDEGLPRHALVCERHTGTGLTHEQIERQNLPLPHQDFVPVSIEEQVICYADKFFSKSSLGVCRTVEQTARSLEKFGAEGVRKFMAWAEMFE